MSESLNFGKIPREVAVKREAVNALAIIRVHNQLPKDEKGVATVTLRQLIDKFASDATGGIMGLLKEYVCAFGAHGAAVITRYMETVYRGTPEEIEQQRAKFNEAVDIREKEIATALRGM